MIDNIYEVLAPNEVLILSRDGDCLTYVANIDGVALLKKSCIDNNNV